MLGFASISELAISELPSTGNSLSVDNIANALSFDSPTLTQKQLLAVSNMAIGVSFDTPTPSVHETLAVANMSIALAYSNFDLVQHQLLVLQNMAIAVAFGSPSPIRGWLLVVAAMSIATSVQERDLQYIYPPPTVWGKEDLTAAVGFTPEVVNGAAVWTPEDIQSPQQ